MKAGIRKVSLLFYYDLNRPDDHWNIIQLLRIDLNLELETSN